MHASRSANVVVVCEGRIGFGLLSSGDSMSTRFRTIEETEVLVKPVNRLSWGIAGTILQRVTTEMVCWAIAWLPRSAVLIRV